MIRFNIKKLKPLLNEISTKSSPKSRIRFDSLPFYALAYLNVNVLN